MGQKHYAQAGTFHITTNTAGRVPWCTLPGVPEMLVDNLCMSRSVHGVKLQAFCILPDHVHLIVSVGEGGLSRFMHSFKKNSSRDVSTFLGRSDFRIAATGNNDFRIASMGNNDVRSDATRNDGYVVGSHDATSHLPANQSPDTCSGGLANISSHNSRSGGSKTAASRQSERQIGWQKGYFDERIRDGRQRSAAVGYVQGNAMKHGYVEDILDWFWTSLHFQDRIDPMEVWWD